MSIQLSADYEITASQLELEQVDIRTESRKRLRYALGAALVEAIEQRGGPVTVVVQSGEEVMPPLHPVFREAPNTRIWYVVQEVPPPESPP